MNAPVSSTGSATHGFGVEEEVDAARAVVPFVRMDPRVLARGHANNYPRGKRQATTAAGFIRSG